MATKSISVIQEANLDAAKRKFLKARQVYDHTGKTTMSDAEFNKLEDAIRRLDPKWKPLHETGSRVLEKKTEVELLAFMPSLDKVYPEGMPKLLHKPWAKKATSWIEMHKLDGTALQLAYEGRPNRLKPTRLITRGDGALGGDISFFIPWLVENGQIPATIKADSPRVVIRLEGIMKKATFARKWSRKAKGKNGFDNIRNMVNGLFNRQDQHPALKDVDMVILGVYGYTIASGLHHARLWGFNVVGHAMVRPMHITADRMSRMLEDERKNSQYEMDGLVFGPIDFKMVYEDNKRPKQLLAFKFNDEANATAVKIESFVWQKSRLKRWNPKITIPPTKMDGVTVTNASAHNPAWLKERGIGPGAVVKVLRSGGVIPKIVGVVKKSKFVEPPGPYEIRGRFFYMLEHDKTSEVRGIHHFMATLGIEQLAVKRLARLYDAGFKTAHSYLQVARGGPPMMKEKQVKGKGLFVHTQVKGTGAALKMQQQFVDAGFGELESYNMVASLYEVLSKTINLKLLMVASGCFVNGGMGRDKLAQLEAAGLSMRELCNMKADQIRGLKIKGFSTKTLDVLALGITEFRKWYKPVKDLLKVNGELPAKKRTVKGPLTDVKVAFTSYRDPEQEAKIVALGGTVVKYGPSMDILLWRKGAKFMDKIEKAGAKAMHWPAFCAKYGVR